MALFGDKRPTVSSLGEETKGVLSVFRKALDNLSNINTRAEEERQLKLVEIKQAEEEAAALKVLCEDNTAVMDNISKLINKEKNVKQQN